MYIKFEMENSSYIYATFTDNYGIVRGELGCISGRDLKVESIDLDLYFVGSLNNAIYETESIRGVEARKVWNELIRKGFRRRWG